MNYNDLVRDFALRTRQNLNYLREEKAARPEVQVFEVTQLINSLLGLLVFPQQRFMSRIPPTPLAELASQGWPIPRVVGDYPQVTDLNQLVRFLRNAVSHFNLEFQADGSGQNVAMRVWNTRSRGSGPSRQEEKTWQAELSIADIERITDKFITLLLHEANPSPGAAPGTSPGAPREVASIEPPAFAQTQQAMPLTPTVLPASKLPSGFIDWHRALIRSGFSVSRVGESFDLSGENRRNREFLESILQELGLHPPFNGHLFSPSSPAVDEAAWLGAIERLHSGSEGGPSDMENIELRIMDTYMAGIVRWVNAAGLKTTFSCDGHTRAEPRLHLLSQEDISLLKFCFSALSDGRWCYTPLRLFKREAPLHTAQRGRAPLRNAPHQRNEPLAEPYDRTWLLDVAEAFYDNQTAVQAFVEAGRCLKHQRPAE